MIMIVTLKGRISLCDFGQIFKFLADAVIYSTS